MQYDFVDPSLDPAMFGRGPGNNVYMSAPQGGPPMQMQAQMNAFRGGQLPQQNRYMSNAQAMQQQQMQYG